MPAHIIRSLVGARETHDPHEIWICPNLPPALLEPGKHYGLTALRCGTVADPFGIEYDIVDSAKISITLTCSTGTQVTSVRAGNQVLRPSQAGTNRSEFRGSNNERYLVRFNPRD
jgi:hypothetical protein